jgi:lysozyme
MQNPMTTSENGYNLIKRFEGLRLAAYNDGTGVITIGYGTIRINDQPIQTGTVITEDQANQLLQNEVQGFETYVNQYVQIQTTQNQFDALISFTYNLGQHNLLMSTLLRKLNQGDIQGAAAEFPKWDMAGGHVWKGLLDRRLAEQALFEQA